MAREKKSRKARVSERDLTASGLANDPVYASLRASAPTEHVMTKKRAFGEGIKHTFLGVDRYNDVMQRKLTEKVNKINDQVKALNVEIQTQKELANSSDKKIAEAAQREVNALTKKKDKEEAKITAIEKGAVNMGDKSVQRVYNWTRVGKYVIAGVLVAVIVTLAVALPQRNKIDAQAETIDGVTSSLSAAQQTNTEQADIIGNQQDIIGQQTQDLADKDKQIEDLQKALEGQNIPAPTLDSWSDAWFNPDSGNSMPALERKLLKGWTVGADITGVVKSDDPLVSGMHAYNDKAQTLTAVFSTDVSGEYVRVVLTGVQKRAYSDDEIALMVASGEIGVGESKVFKVVNVNGADGDHQLLVTWDTKDYKDQSTGEWKTKTSGEVFVDSFGGSSQTYKNVVGSERQGYRVLAETYANEHDLTLGENGAAQQE